MIRSALKRAALLIPPLRRLREERNAAVQRVTELEAELRQRDFGRATMPVAAAPNTDAIAEHLAMGYTAIWNADKIANHLYRSKFIGVADHLLNWLADYGGLRDKEILDFGCGEATTALGVALRHAPRRIVGADIAPMFDKCLPSARAQLGLEALPPQLSFATIAPDAAMDGLGQFDFIYSWSVFEHVSQELVGSRLRMLSQLLKTGGLIFVQIAPLYFSAEGSHMKPWVPQPWAHLHLQNNRFKEQLFAAADPNEVEVLWMVYETLNKMTAPQLRQEMEAAGFEILRDYRTKDELEIPSGLRDVYAEDVLLTNQIVLLAKRSAG